ncbi:MAG: CopD family protein [Nitrospira sp.]|nr:CopD family protein [Nitrospira sp.]
MIESLGALFRFIQLAANMIIIGGCVFLAIAEDKNAPAAAPWSSRAKRALPWFALTVIVGLLGLLATTTAQATGITENAWRIDAWLTFIQKTRIGLIWTLREISAVVLLGVTLYVRFSPATRWRYIICASFAALPLAIGTLASHSAAEEKSIEAILPYTLHLVLASVWLGGLPGVLVILFSTHSADRATLLPLKRFSTMALPVMVAIVATGIIVADRMVSPNYAALFATQYGWLLNTKLALLGVILSIAARAHFVWLPSLTNGGPPSSHEVHTLRRWLAREFGLAIALLAVATLLAGAVPAKHEVIDYWPYPFRFSIAATWDDWLVRTLVFSGVILLVISAGLLVMGTKKRWGLTWRVIVPAPLLIFSLILIFYPISVQSYPETYRKTPVPFDSISISNGMDIFSENCVPCHGPQAKGDGVLAKTLPKKPIDLLTEPHTAMHTAGDFFHWLTYGRFNGIMPAFGDKLSEEERWDVLNFLHANARGYQARIITPRILPGQPFMVPPNFSYSAHNGLRGTLKDFRGQENVLLVLFSWPESRARLEELRAFYPLLKEGTTEILAVPINKTLPDDMLSYLPDVPFPVVTQGAEEISRSYALFRRTITYPDLFGNGTVPKHMEFLFDRFGYLRARWIPERSEGPGWSDLNFLKQQIDQLQREKEILPPPDDHVH